MLSNFEIEKIFKSYNVELAIMPCLKDELPKQAVEGNYVINLQSSGVGNFGTHWLSLRIEGKEAFYFDSFGGSPPKEIVKFVKTIKGSHLSYNDWIIQNLSAETCGYYASSILIYCEKNKSDPLYSNAKSFLKLFKDDTTLNDDVLKEVYKSFSTKIPLLIKRLNKETIKYKVIDKLV